jgi:NAD(P)-dependent dehydrogenase (short-subunit alcohol dehydrogenase family)
VELVICDFADDAGVEACIAQVPAVDMIVNNAGFHVQAEVCDTSVELFRKITQVNFYAPARLLGHYLALPAAQRPKRIVNVLSTGAIFGRLDLGAYSATKGALWSLTRSIRRLFGDIHVVEVLPSNFESNLFKSSIQVEPTGRKWSPVYGSIPSAREAAEYIAGQVAKGREIVFFPRIKLLIILVLEALFPKFIRKRFS